MDISIRQSVSGDLNSLLQLEKKAFPIYQQSSRRTLSLSLKSSFQQVWVVEDVSGDESNILGCLILYIYKKAVRVFSVVVDPEFQGKGIGKMLLNKTREIAKEKEASRIILEMDANNRKLINWYKKEGFESAELMSDYYEEGKDAFRMVMDLPNE